MSKIAQKKMKLFALRLYENDIEDFRDYCLKNDITMSQAIRTIMKQIIELKPIFKNNIIT